MARPGAMVAWAVLAGVALAWIGSAIYGVVHAPFETGRDRLNDFLGVGSFSYAVALVVGLIALVLIPSATASPASPVSKDDDGGEKTDPPKSSVDAGDHLLLSILGIAGLVVAVASVVLFVSDLTEVGGQPDLSISTAVDELATIPLALAVALWARALLPNRPPRAAATPTYAPGPGPYGQYGQPYGQPPAPQGPGQPPSFGQPSGPSPQGPPPQGPPPQGPPSQGPPPQGQPPQGPGSQGPPPGTSSPPPYGQPGGPGQSAPYGTPYGQGPNPPPYGQQPPPGYGGQPPG